MTDTDATEVARYTHALSQIAKALDCPVEALKTGDGLPLSLTGLGDLTALWGTLKTDASRQAVLKLVQAIAEAE